LAADILNSQRFGVWENVGFYVPQIPNACCLTHSCHQQPHRSILPLRSHASSQYDISHLNLPVPRNKGICLVYCLVCFTMFQHHSLVDPPTTHVFVGSNATSSTPVSLQGQERNESRRHARHHQLDGDEKTSEGDEEKKTWQAASIISITSYIHQFIYIYDISSSKPPFSSGISQPRLLTRDPFVKKNTS